MISAGPSLLHASVMGSAASLRMKQSSPLIFFSPMHLALQNMLAIVLGSRPCEPPTPPQKKEYRIIRSSPLLREELLRNVLALNAIQSKANRRLIQASKHHAKTLKIIIITTLCLPHTKKRPNSGPIHGL